MKLLPIAFAALAAVTAASPTLVKNSVSSVPERIAARQSCTCDSLCRKYKCCKGMDDWCGCSASAIATFEDAEAAAVEAHAAIEISKVQKRGLEARQRTCDSLCHKYNCCKGMEDWCGCSPSALASFQAAELVAREAGVEWKSPMNV
ncbi:hypothetical protein K458DRAFT_400111 [Lentithecium fluviatile CBS 122367]|uniref:Uncharacterized protein n=1 Tax=Lentithecium fluviatile CBS 122367 TaxID=1168545 RepID=A0A6G1JFI9_9PLEO|nr:hypothetical protein K458DRAFT_400111 [Lentithecium fluviatile CBS 122367]